jgi:replicative DNA helicase
MEENILKTEKRFIYLLLKNKNLVSEWMESNLKKEHFDIQHRAILIAILDSFDKGVLLTRKSFMSFVERTKVPRDRISQELTFNECLYLKASVDDFPLLLNQILEYYLLKVSTRCIKDFSETVKKKGVQSAIQQLSTNMQGLSIDFAYHENDIFYDDIRSLSDEFIKNIEGIRDGTITAPPKILCGIKEIDDTLGNGLAPGELTLFCADVGGFKSMIMLNIALNVWEMGYDVLIVPIEMRKESTYHRAISRQASVDNTKFKNPILLSQEEKDRVDKAVYAWNNFEDSKIYILDTSMEMTVSFIERQIKKHISEFKPQLVVIDYTDNLEPDKNRGERVDIEVRDMLKRLRTAGKDLGFHIVSAAQLGKEALKKVKQDRNSRQGGSPLSSVDIRGAHSFAMYADTVYGQLPNVSQPQGLLDLFVIKSRHGKASFANGTQKATLEVYPEVSLIRSQQDLDIPQEADDVLDTIFDEEENRGVDSFDEESDNGVSNEEFSFLD